MSTQLWSTTNGACSNNFNVTLWYTTDRHEPWKRAAKPVFL